VKYVVQNIAKFAAFVILLGAGILDTTGCASDSFGSKRKVTNSVYSDPQVVGHLANTDITEASGITASKCQPGVFWTHNDSGDDAFIFAFNAAGDNLGTWRVKNAENNDWEDIAEFKDASGACFVYIGDIGDNKLRRDVHTIYRVREPSVLPNDVGSTRKNARETDAAERLNFNYSDSNQNSETLMVHPATGDIYVLSKSHDKPSGVYKLKPNFGDDVERAERIAEVKVPSIPFGLLTGGDISPDGRHVVLCDYADGYELTLPNGDNNFDDIWKQQPLEIDLGDRDTGEAVGYSADGSAIFATTENKRAPIIELRKKG
jgi:hypothetical protein